MEKSINSFLIDFKSADYGTHKSAFDCLKSKLVSQYQSLGQLVYQRQQTIKERKKQNKSILKITKALKKADRLLGSVSINSFSLNIYSEKVNSLVLELENSYLFLPQDIDDDLEPRYVKAGIEMQKFLDGLEIDIEKKSSAVNITKGGLIDAIRNSGLGFEILHEFPDNTVYANIHSCRDAMTSIFISETHAKIKELNLDIKMPLESIKQLDDLLDQIFSLVGVAGLRKNF